MFLLLVLKPSLKDDASKMKYITSVMENAVFFMMKDVDRDLVTEYDKRKYGLMELTNVALFHLSVAISAHQTRAEVIFIICLLSQNFHISF